MNAREKEGVIRTLYLAMPGSKTPPIFDGEYMWGEVDETEHWEFCERIVDLLAAREVQP